MLELPDLYNTIIGGLVVAALTGINGVIFSLFKKKSVIRKWKEKEEVKGKIELGPERFKLVKSTTFIPTMGQTEGPHDSDIITISDNRFDLADKLLKEIFSIDERVWKKRFAILGGSGMGKSTFSAYFFYKYISYYKYKECKYPIYIKYLGQKNVLADLSKMTTDNDVSQAILILDALDENIDATMDMESFMDNLEEIIDKYRIVILTSRTQFFPNKNREPSKGTVIQNSPTNKLLPWQKIYISPFNEEETIKYLEQKYKIPSDEYSKAKRIADMSNDLMMRPMILSFIDDLLDLAGNRTILVSEVYARIIEKWLSKECEGQKVNYIDLFTFSKKLSLFIYDKWEQSGGAFVSDEDFQHFMLDNGYHDSPYSFKERSLVNRRNDGSIKFSHKSFLEFFLAINSIENPGKSFKSGVFDVADNFAKELYQMYINGKEFLGISYSPSPVFNFDNQFSSLESIIKEGENYMSDKSLVDCEKKVLMNKLLYNYWELTIQCLPYLYEKLPYKQFTYNSKRELLQKSEKLTEPIEECLANLQKCMLNNNSLSYKKIFFVIEDCHKTISLYYQLPRSVFNEGKNGLTKGTRERNNKDFIIFPSIYSKEFLTDNLLSNYVNVGIGFNDDETIYKLVNKCLDNKDILDIICIYKESANLDILANFIQGLCNSLNVTSPCIIIAININKSRLHYVINRQTISYKLEQIKNCLSNMLALDSAILSYNRPTSSELTS